MTDRLSTARELADWAIVEIARHRLSAGDVETKTNAADYVTVVDRAIERRVRDVLHERFPDDLVVGEEMPDSGGAGPVTWYVDPIDGTTNYVFGVPWSSFSLAAADREGGLVGVVADPWRREIISAERGQGAWINDEPVTYTDRDSLTGGVMLTEWSAFRPWPGMRELLGAMSAAGCTTRIMGSSALSLASAGVGRATAAIVGRYNTWDVLGGAIIAREAGAAVLGRDGQPAPQVPSLEDNGLLVVAPGVVDEVCAAWRDALAAAHH